MQSLPLEELMPHRPPMILLSGYEPESLTDEGVSAYVDVRETDLFYDSALGGVPGVIALEYLAQCVACFVGLHGRGAKPRAGFIIGSRHLEIAAPAFLPGARYTVSCKLLFADDAFASFEGRIADDSGRCVAEGAIDAFQTGDPITLLEEESS